MAKPAYQQSISSAKTMEVSLLLFASGLLAGAMNAIAGGGSFVSFPVLLSTGISPVTANASNTVALLPGSLAVPGVCR